MTSFRAVFIGLIGMSGLGSPPLTAQSVGEPFDEAYERLRSGPEYMADVPTGRLELTRTNRDGLLHRYVVIVPEDYDPARRYPVAFYLHGGVARPECGVLLSLGPRGVVAGKKIDRD